MIKKYRIIGDIHGRHNWHSLIEPFDKDTIYVFTGDYTDPYYGYEKDVTYEGMLDEIEYMLNFKRKHMDNVILLIGNHDMQYIANIPETSRFDRNCYEKLHEIFVTNKDLFYGIAYSIGEKYIITHAGITEDWYYKYLGKYDKDTMSLEYICNQINNLWIIGKEAFTFSKNVTKMSDYYGTSPMHSPVWIRPTSLWQNNLFGFENGIIQIVGHTPFDSLDNFENSGKVGTFGTIKEKLTIDEIEIGPDYWITDGNDNKCELVENNNEHVDIIFVDCLRIEPACIEINEETLEWKKIIN